MGYKIESQCCGCATDNYPCKGEECSRRNVPVFFCDKCGLETGHDALRELDGEDLCVSCLMKTLPEVKKPNDYC